MIAVNPNPAQTVKVDAEETWDDFVERLYKRSSALTFENGSNIEVNPDSKYAVLALEISDIATQEQFAGLLFLINEAITKAEAAGIVPANWCKSVATLFNLEPPQIPQRFLDEIEGAVCKIIWTGTQRYTAVRELPDNNMPQENESSEQE